MSRPHLPCAIYTRKSSEEGLEQGFNSLDAQREACEAFILSQRHEGWRPVPTHYDDGGYSGGNMDRPALKTLLEDIRLKRVRVVVVYKVDRLTRSLADFAKIVELFDSHGVSFVSVTQQFNTTSSMGRLTLNVLLSFAQFEREITGERIRDKIAASKQKGMWMGGCPPLGYVARDRSLVIDEAHAGIVKLIFEHYLALGCVRSVKRELDRRGVGMPVKLYCSGRQYGGRPFCRGQLYRMLSNPVYLGQVAHKGKVYPGQHPALITESLWNAVQDQLRSKRQGYHRKRAMESDSLLAGVIADGEGNRLIPSHTQKRSKRYRYYVSEHLVNGTRENVDYGIRIPAIELEQIVIDRLLEWLGDPAALVNDLNPAADDIQIVVSRGRRLSDQLGKPGNHYALLHQLVRQVVIHPHSLEIHVYSEALFPGAGIPQTSADIVLRVAASLKRCGLSNRLIVMAQGTAGSPTNSQLAQQVMIAREWLDLLTSGKVTSISELASLKGSNTAFTTRILYRAFLAPDIVRAIIAGNHPPEFNLESLKKHFPLPIDWVEQRKLLGFPLA